MNSMALDFIETKYERIKCLGKSDKNEVWLVSDASGNLAVLKRIKATGLPFKFLKEQPNYLWPKVIYFVESADESLIVEELVSGSTLSDLLQQEKVFTESEVRSFILQLCAGLSVLHTHGIVHRDIKPSNLMLTSDGRIKLIDFDAARTIKVEQEEDTRLLGTKGYAPPEQFGYGQTDGRSDIYSLGKTMQELLGNDYHGYLKGILNKCCAIDMEQRFQSAGELAQAVEKRNYLKKAYYLIAVFIVICLISGIFIWERNQVEFHEQESVIYQQIPNNGIEQEKELKDETVQPPQENIDKIPKVTNETAPRININEGENSKSTVADVQPDGNMYATLYLNGNAFPMSITNRFSIEQQEYSKWQRINEQSGKYGVYFPENWQLSVLVVNDSPDIWNEPAVEFSISQWGGNSQTFVVKHNNPLSPGGRDEFVISLGEIYWGNVAARYMDIGARLLNAGEAYDKSSIRPHAERLYGSITLDFAP